LTCCLSPTPLPRERGLKIYEILPPSPQGKGGRRDEVKD